MKNPAEFAGFEWSGSGDALSLISHAAAALLEFFARATRAGLITTRFHLGAALGEVELKLAFVWRGCRRVI